MNDDVDRRLILLMERWVVEVETGDGNGSGTLRLRGPTAIGRQSAEATNDDEDFG